MKKSIRLAALESAHAELTRNRRHEGLGRWCVPSLTREGFEALEELAERGKQLQEACKFAVNKLESLRETVGWNEGSGSESPALDSPALTLDPPYIDPAIRALRAAIKAAESTDTRIARLKEPGCLNPGCSCWLEAE